MYPMPQNMTRNLSRENRCLMDSSKTIWVAAIILTSSVIRLTNIIDEKYYVSITRVIYVSVALTLDRDCYPPPKRAIK